MYLLGTYGGFYGTAAAMGIHPIILFSSMTSVEQERMYALMMRYQDTPMI